MDRSVTPINVPAPVVPYAPPTPAYKQTLVPKHTLLPKHSLVPNLTPIDKKQSASSADFSSFGSGAVSDNIDEDYEYDLGFVETDRIDQQIHPNAVLYSANSAPYGEQFPSYLPKSMATMVRNFKPHSTCKDE